MTENVAGQMVLVVVLVSVGTISVWVMAKWFTRMMDRARGLGSKSYRESDHALLRQLSLKERRQVDQLARSRERINDPDLADKAAAACRKSLASLEASETRPPWMYLFGILIFVDVVARIVTETPGWGLWLRVGSSIFVLLGVIYLPRWARRQRHGYEETARINGWSVEAD